jgi:hypothetical protein
VRAVERAAPKDSLSANELDVLQGLRPALSGLDVERILAHGLEAASKVGSASASVILLTRSNGNPLIATTGLTTADAWHDRVGLPPECPEARAVQLSYSYRDEVDANDAFAVRSALVVPITSEEERLGTLALYWRRVQHEATEQELGELQAVARAIGAALTSARGRGWLVRGVEFERGASALWPKRSWAVLTIFAEFRGAS